MARRSRKSKQEAASGLLVITAMLIIFALILAPVATIIYKIYISAKLSKILPNIQGNFSDFWLDSSEKKLYQDKKIKLNKVTRIVKAVHMVAGQNHTLINQDDLYSKVAL